MLSAEAIAERYLDLVEKSITNVFYAPAGVPPTAAQLDKTHALRERLLSRFGDHIAKKKADDPSFFSPLDLPPEALFGFISHMGRDAQSMTTPGGIANVRACVKDVLDNGVEGDFIEAGAWKGGLCVLMRAMLEVYGDSERTVYVADSFEGLPKVEPEGNLADAIAYAVSEELDHLSVDEAKVRATFEAYDLDSRVEILTGWFSDTLPDAGFEKLAIARLDGDWYSSTWDALTHLYPKLSPGGYLILDDYGLPLGCREAADTYRKEHGITAPIEMADDAVGFWQKPVE